MKNVLGKTFRETDIYTAIETCLWATKTRYYFYDTSRNPWPIARMEYSSDSMTNSPFPLTQSELLDQTLAQMQCVSFTIAEWNRLVRSMSKGATLDCDYTQIIIKSAERDLSDYNFYEAVTGVSDIGWFGYRVLSECTFSKFCGANNMLNIGTDDAMGTSPLIFDRDVVDTNTRKGFPTVRELYHPSSLLETFDYDFCSMHTPGMPIAYIFNPFTARDAEGDEPLQVPCHNFDESTYSPSRKRRVGDEYDQSSALDDSPLPDEGSGSSPLQDMTNYGTQRPCESSQSPRTVKRRRLVIDDDDNEDEQATPPPQ